MNGPKTENINKLMRLIGYTQIEMAGVVKVDRAAVSHWMNGKAEPRDTTCEIIADYFGLEPRNLIEPDGMKHVHMGSDGKLYEDKDAVLADKIARLRELTETSDDADTEELLRNVQHVIETVERETDALTKQETELLLMFNSLNAEGRKLIMQTLNAYVKSAVFAQR